MLYARVYGRVIVEGSSSATVLTSDYSSHSGELLSLSAVKPISSSLARVCASIFVTSLVWSGCVELWTEPEHKKCHFPGLTSSEARLTPTCDAPWPPRHLRSTWHHPCFRGSPQRAATGRGQGSQYRQGPSFRCILGSRTEPRNSSVPKGRTRSTSLECCTWRTPFCSRRMH